MIIKAYNDAEVAKLKPLPENVTAATWGPQVKILSRSLLFITHGGCSSIKEAIYFGVPMIVFPHCWDQPGMAARVKYHHLGLTGNLKRVNAKVLGDLIDRVSNQSSFRHPIKKMQKVFREQENCQNGIDYIERFLEKNKYD